MQNRRQFVKAAFLAGASVRMLNGRDTLVAYAREPGAFGGPLRPEDVLDMGKMKPRGQTYEATIPDTLDLADRARLAINALTHLVVPDTWYYDMQEVNFGPHERPPGPRGGFDITPKFARSLPWMRTMCGSDAFLDREYGMMKAMLSNVREDGLLYYPVDGNRAGNSSYPDVNGILGLACENHYLLDGNAGWLEWIRHLATGLEKVAIRVEDRAYYPPECSIDPQGKWHWNLRGESSNYQPPDEPTLDTQGLEGCVKFEQGYAMRALVRACRYFGSEPAAEVLDRLTRFCMKPGLWVDTSKTPWEGYKGNEHGIWCCHFHENASTLLALLDVAELRQSSWLKEVVREGYEHGVRNGIVRMGWFEDGLGGDELDSEPDAQAEMIELGVRLSDAGLGEYWDDVDGIVRNHLAESQFCDLSEMERLAKGGPLEGRMGEFLGGYNNPAVTAGGPSVMACCTANGSMGLYYAWHGITRFSEGVATVNLLLNRASKWMDVHSYLPYEGKVELHNKEARVALVRAPYWVEMKEVKSYVDDRAARPATSGRYLVFEGLQTGQIIRLEFPNPETTDTYTIKNQVYRLKFRGSTVVDIDPKSKDPGEITLYERSRLLAREAPRHTVQRFVAENIVPLQ